MADLTSLREVIEDTPTADVVEVKHGKWIKDNNKRTCSRCGWYYFSNGVDSNYCSECGARMNGKAEEIKCIDCKHRMFSDMYCECSKGYKGIVQPWDGCEHGEKTEE